MKVSSAAVPVRPAVTGARQETPVRALLRLLQIASYKSASGKPVDLTHMSRQVAELILKAPPAEQLSHIAALTHADWPHAELIAALCALPASLCAPLLRHSPVLDQGWLWKIVQAGEEGHALSIAARTDLGPDLLTALIRRDQPALWLALLNNPHILWLGEHMDVLVERARNHLSLRGALVRHPALSAVQAERLLGFVGPVLKAQLLKRIAPSGALAGGQVIPAASRFAAARGTWLNRLQHGDIEGCRTAMARQLNQPVAVIDKALRSAAAVALLLRALGVDPAAFSSLYERLQELNDGQPKATPAQRRLLTPLLQISEDEALKRLKALKVS